MTKKSTLSQWRERLDDQAYSGLSVERWCAAHQIPSHRFYYWRRKVSAAAVPHACGDIDWLALPLIEPQAASPQLTVRVGGAAIDIARGFDPAYSGDGLRQSVTVTPPDGSAATTGFVWDGHNVLHEIEPNGTLTYDTDLPRRNRRADLAAARERYRLLCLRPVNPARKGHTVWARRAYTKGAL